MWERGLGHTSGRYWREWLTARGKTWRDWDCLERVEDEKNPVKLGMKDLMGTVVGFIAIAEVHGVVQSRGSCSRLGTNSRGEHSMRGVEEWAAYGCTVPESMSLMHVQLRIVREVVQVVVVGESRFENSAFAEMETTPRFLPENILTGTILVKTIPRLRLLLLFGLHRCLGRGGPPRARSRSCRPHRSHLSIKHWATSLLRF